MAESEVSEESASSSNKMKRQYISRLFPYQGRLQPKTTDLTCKSHKLLLYNDLITPEHIGVFHLLPLAVRSLSKLTSLIDEELCKIGALKISMPCLTSSDLWKKTGRWNSMGPELFRLQDRHGLDYCLGPTHEEAVTELVASHAPISYRSLPIMLYQSTRKFRDEMAPKYGLLRGREFEMKDLYTFDESEEKAKETYSRVCEAYSAIFDKLGLPYVKVRADTGAIGGSLSHEFHLPAAAGEDTLLICSQCGEGSNKELIDTSELSNHRCHRENCGPDFQEKFGIEVGHAFLLGTKYSKPFKAFYLTKAGKQELLQMGCYGLGVTRVLQAAVEVLSLDNQIRWPTRIAPYKICILPQKEGYKGEVFAECADNLYDTLSCHPALTGDVIIDDRTHMTIGKRLYEAKRHGFPILVVLGKKVLDSSPEYEVLNLATDRTEFMSQDQLTAYCIEHLTDS